MNHEFSFIAYVDEYGDEGFKFPENGNQGSSLWFALSAAVFWAHHDHTKCVESVKAKLRKSPAKPLHFRDLEHEKKILCAREVGLAPIRSINVAVYKPNLTERSTFSQRGRLFSYASKFLLERVSWLCYRAHLRHPHVGDGSVNVIFSQHNTFDPEDFGKYLRNLERDPRSHMINWQVVHSDAISAVPNGDLHGLQVADVLAGSLGAALTPHPTSQIAEHRYLKALWHTLYSYQGQVHTYGLKIYPSTATQLGNAIPEELMAMLGLQAAQ